VTDISPLRALAELRSLICSGSGPNSGKLSSLSPLEGIPLERLECNNTDVFDLTVLKGMPLTFLACHRTQVSNLSPLAGMPLVFFGCDNCKQISDLSPLHGIPLTTVTCLATQIADLSPLENCKSLTFLNVKSSKVTPASVAALQKALPNCKIEWDDPARPKTPEPAASGKK
jgi:Leucine-rich repeat (LRR) protein